MVYILDSSEFTGPRTVGKLTSHMSWPTGLVDVNSNLLESRLQLKVRAPGVSEYRENVLEVLNGFLQRESSRPVVSSHRGRPPPPIRLLSRPRYTVIALVSRTGDAEISVAELWKGIRNFCFRTRHLAN